MSRTAVKTLEDGTSLAATTPLEFVESGEPLHGVKMIQRDIAGGFPTPPGAWDVASFDAYVSQYLNAGWTLHSTHCAKSFLATEKQIPVFSMVYVLVR